MFVCWPSNPQTGRRRADSTLTQEEKWWDINQLNVQLNVQNVQLSL